MTEKELMIKEFYLCLRKGIHEPAAGDIITLADLQKSLYKKYALDISEERFNELGDEVVETGDFYWNNDGKLALGITGLEKLAKLR